MTTQEYARQRIARAKQMKLYYSPNETAYKFYDDVIQLWTSRLEDKFNDN